MDNKLRVINYLGKHPKKRFTMHELSKLLGIPYASFYRTIQTMKDLLVMETVGRSTTIMLNTQNRIVKAHLIVSSDEEKKEYLKKNLVIRKIVNDLSTDDIVVLFGSYAKGKETEKSDIDILIINNDGKKSLSFSKQELLYKKKINPIFITKKEFTQMLKGNEENVGTQALKDHIILNNPERFWECVLQKILCESV